MNTQRLGNVFNSKLYFAIMALWAVVMLFVVLQYRALEQSNRSVDELNNSVIHLRNTLYFQEPYRANRSRDLALNIQQINSLRLQLEQDWQQQWLQPDMSQLLYVTDRFIELAQSFVTIELSVSDFVTQWSQLRDKYISQPDLQLRYWQIGAYVFQALHSEGQQSPQLYRTFDDLLDYSYQLPQQQQNELQQTLAAVSSLLSKYAEGGNQVDKLLEHQVHDEVALINMQLQRDFKILTILAMTTSVVTLLLVVWLHTRCHNQRLTTTDAPSRAAERENVDGTDLPTSTNSTSAVDPKDNLSSTLIEPRALSSDVDIDAMLSALDYDHASVYLLLEVFVEDHQHDCELLTQLLSTDREAASRKVHSLKGVASSLGAKGLKEIATAIEQTIRGGGTPSDMELKSLSQQLQQTLVSAQNLLRQRTCR